MATSNSVANEAAVREAVRAIIMNAPMDKIVGNPTNVNIQQLRKQAAKIVSTIPTTQWGGQTGHLALVLRNAEFRIATNDPDAVTTPIGAVPLVPTGLLNNLTLHSRTCITNEHGQLQNEKWTQTAVNHFMVNRITTELIDSTYVEELEDEYTGYNNQTIKTLFAHIKTEWCVVTTMEKTKALDRFKERCDGVTHITKYAKELERRQLECTNIGAEATDEGKLQTYVEGMWESDLFDDKEMNKWEERATTDKTWANAKLYFVPLYKTKTRITKEREQREERRGHLDSANSITSNRSTRSPSNFTQPPTEVSTMTTEEQSNIVEYCNNLEGTLTSKNEQLDELKSTIASFEQRMVDQQKEMQKDRMEFMKMMRDMAKTGGRNNTRGDGGGGANKDRNPTNRPSNGRYCKNCKLPNQIHNEKNCWELEENKHRRPADWKSVFDK